MEGKKEYEESWNTPTPNRTERSTIEFRLPVAKMTLGKITVLLLTLAMMIDFGVSHIHQHHRIESSSSSPVHDYDGNGIDRPKDVRQNTKLGSAAISTITDVLSPILPFAGGMDLRRDDYWSSPGTWYERVRNVSDQVRQAFGVSAPVEVNTLPRGGSKVQVKKRRPTKHSNVISAPKPFMDTAKIAELTLGDVADAFRYAVESSKAEFSEPKFRYKKSPRVVNMIKSMKDAVAESRGRDVLDTTTDGDSRLAGSVDALKFSAALRIFAEWRVVRQVPEGYKGYAVGMSLGQKDVVQNLVKIEQGIHELLDHWRDLNFLQDQLEGYPSSDAIRTPTLRQLMEHEIEMGIHTRLPRLKEKSAGMGLLWVRRQIMYQTGIFGNILQVPRKFKDTEAAVAGAYKEVYDRFHGWAVQKIFNYSFQSAPEASVIYRHMNPNRLEEVLKAADKIDDDTPESDDAQSQDGGIAHYFGWASRLFGETANAEVPATEAVSVESKKEEFITREMVKDAHMHINSYLEVARPLLTDLTEVFDQLNMNDPTKV